MVRSVRLIFIFCILQFSLCSNEWNTVYLASFPRSGNHWVRFLVEEATHIATSSVYRDRDYPHLRNTFPWGGYCTEFGYEGHCRYPTKQDPVLLKTHYPFLPKQIIPSPKSTICLIRHPIDSFWSFYTYRGGNDGKIDEASLKQFIHGWKKFYEYWEAQPEVLFIRYEDLQADPRFYLNSILETAGYNFSQEDIDRAITRYPPKGAPLKHSDFYDNQSIERILTELADILTRFHYDDF